MSATQSSPRWTLTFDWTSPPLTANQRHHWRKKADITRKVRAAAEKAARDIPYLDKIRVGMTWVVRTQHRRDVDNTVPTLKALCDGLVDADIVPDDTPEFMVKTMPEIRYEPTATPHIELWIEAVEPDMPGFEGTRAALEALGANTGSGRR